MISIVLIPFLIILFTGRAVSAAPSSPLYAESKHSIRSHIDPTLIRNSPAQRSAFLQAHNNVRTRYHAAPLLWSVFLAQLAEEWADACYFKHTNGILRDKPYGENIVAATGDFSVQSAVATFIQDKSQFDSHFGQVVWKSTRELGCAVSTCSQIFPGHGPTILHVCFYSPARNIIGEIAQNVQV